MGALRRSLTPVALVLAAGIAAMAWKALVPDFFRARDAARVELAARAAQACDAAVRNSLRRGAVKQAKDMTLERVDAYWARGGRPGPVWPAAADLSSIDFADTNGVSVLVSVFGGRRRVSAADLARPPAAP